jgi:hypothetical protein
MKKLLGILVLVLAVCLACTAFAADDVVDHTKVNDGTVVTWGEINSITSINGHAIPAGYIAINGTVTPATCTKEGMVEFTCPLKDEKGNSHQHWIVLKKLDHDWSSKHLYQDWGKVTKPATCMEEGEAVDYCLVCGALGKTRVIEKRHEYSDEVYEYIKGEEPTCAHDGWGQHKCVFCGELRKGDVKDGKHVVGMAVHLPKLEHVWSDWTVKQPASCFHYALLDRTCMLCHEHELLGDDVNRDPNSKDYGKTTTHELFEICPIHGKQSLLTGCPHVIVAAAQKLNGNFNTAAAAIDGSVFNTTAAFEEEKATWNYFKYELKFDLVKDCYERELTYVCPICNALPLMVNGKLNADIDPNHVHVDPAYPNGYSVTLKAPATIAHLWEDKPAIEAAPTCELDGYKVYFCTKCGNPDHATAPVAADFDGTELVDATGVKTGKVYKAYATLFNKADDPNHPGEDWNKTKGTDLIATDPVTGNQLAKTHDIQVKIVKVPALGHKWGEWKETDSTYTKDGKYYMTYVRVCSVCSAREEKLEETEAPAVLDGLVKMDDGDWYYYEDGEWIDDKTGIVEFDGAEFVVVNGIKSKAMGMTNCPGDVFYYLVEGQIQKVTQLAEYKGAWFAIKDGALDTSVNGLVDYDGGKFLFSEGWLRKDINGLCLVDGEWYFFANGQLQQVTQVAEYDGEFFCIKDGKLDKDYNGVINYDGAPFNVVNGQLYPISVAE